MGPALTTSATTTIIAAYTTSEPQQVPSFATPQWVVLGQFTMPKSASNVQVDVQGLVSVAGITLDVQLYDVGVGPVSGSIASTTAVVPSNFKSGAVSLLGGHTYQLQGRVTLEGHGDAYFGVVLACTISN